MSIRENQQKVVDRIKPWNILVSVFNKFGLERIIQGILEVNPGAKFYSTGNTGKKIKEVLGNEAANRYVSIEDFTGSPEMEGGLVKTLHPKVHAGLLAERGNPAHEEFLDKTFAKDGSMPGVYWDIFVGNLYPFNKVITEEKCSPEIARINIDIGGPAMTMAAAKNWPSVAAVTDPALYSLFIRDLKKNVGTTLEQRFNLAVNAMKMIGYYRMAIGMYFDKLDFNRDVRPTLNIK
jgi:phosphoribosylaminoimidazolecarboxamide formyltransferase / IMP cyclohydrolase